MVLASFSLSNHPPLRRVELESAPPLMVIAGPNGVGKSTLLNTLNESASVHQRTSVQFKNGTKSAYYGPHRSPYRANIQENSLIQMDLKPSYDVMGKPNYSNEINGAPSRLNRNHLNNEPDERPYYEVRRRMAQLEHQLSEIARDNYRSAEGPTPDQPLPDITSPLNQAIETVLPNIEFQEIVKERNYYELNFKTRTGEVVKFSDLSSGEKDLISLVFLIVELEIEKELSKVGAVEPDNDDLMILIDGPESYLHPSLQLDFLDYIRDHTGITDQNGRSIQVIMCTHSHTILNNVREDELYYLVFPDMVDGNQLIGAERINIDLLETITGELGNAALSTGKPLLLVEGDSDREILRRLYPELQNEVTILPMGGKNQVMSLENAFSKLVPELITSGIKIYALVDRDRPISGDSNVDEKIFQLPKTCMENLLLNPSAIYQALSSLADHSNLVEEGIHAPDDISKILADIVSSEEFIDREVKLRLNEVLEIQVHIEDSDPRDQDFILDKFDKTVDKKKKRVIDSLDDIEIEVNKAINNRKYGELDGKYILNQIAERVGVKGDSLAKITAVEMADLGTRPERVTEFINKVKASQNGQRDVN